MFTRITPVIHDLFEEHGKTINFVCHILTNENVYLADKMRSSDWTAKLCRFLDLDAVIVSQEGFGNPDTDLIMNTKKIEAEGVKTVIITMSMLDVMENLSHLLTLIRLQML